MSINSTVQRKIIAMETMARELRQTAMGCISTLKMSSGDLGRQHYLEEIVEDARVIENKVTHLKALAKAKAIPA